jgi:competence protein ComFC
MVVVYKDGDERRLANYCAAELLAAIPPSWWQWADCLTWIPSDKRSLRRRGFSPIRLIAHKLSALVEVPAQALLKKSPTKDQRHLGRSGRRANLLGCFSLLDATERPFPGGSGRSLSLETARCGSGHSLPDKVVLIDDVFTTGATLDSAAAQLCEGGVSEVRVATLVRVW